MAPSLLSFLMLATKVLISVSMTTDSKQRSGEKSSCGKILLTHYLHQKVRMRNWYHILIGHFKCISYPYFKDNPPINDTYISSK